MNPLIFGKTNSYYVYLLSCQVSWRNSSPTLTFHQWTSIVVVVLAKTRKGSCFPSDVVLQEKGVKEVVEFSPGERLPSPITFASYTLCHLLILLPKKPDSDPLKKLSICSNIMQHLKIGIWTIVKKIIFEG